MHYNTNMNIKPRYLTENIIEDLNEKMVFLGGPRQVGKTTAAKELVAGNIKSSYYNWDRISDRTAALKGEWVPDYKLIILDEFHKHSKWKTWIKGEFDTHRDVYQFLLTGSARLNIFRRGGDYFVLSYFVSITAAHLKHLLCAIGCAQGMEILI